MRGDVDVPSPDRATASVEASFRHPVALRGARGALALKRAADIIGSLIALICTLPILVLACLAIVVDSPGAPFFVQTRVGLRGRRFGMLKLRSMFVDADRRLGDPDAATKAAAAGRVLKLRRDPRVTRVGRWLRATSLDELPQFLNVLLGQMSLVGPRPLLPPMVAAYPEWAHVRSVVRPGLTGEWQVSARERNESLADMIDHDVAYINGWSLRRDLAILVRTPRAVLSRKGAV